MDKFRAAAGTFFTAYLSPAGLVIGKITAGRNFPVGILTGKPHFKIIGFGSRETQVPGTQFHHPVMQVKFFKDGFGVFDQFIKLCGRFLRSAKFDQLHFIELVLPNQSLRVFALRTRLSPEARSVGGITDGQRLLFQNFIAMKISNRNFCSRDKV